jgi:hypothetical protein
MEPTERALHWWGVAAEAGHAGAQYSLASLPGAGIQLPPSAPQFAYEDDDCAICLLPILRFDPKMVKLRHLAHAILIHQNLHFTGNPCKPYNATTCHVGASHMLWKADAWAV